MCTLMSLRARSSEAFLQAADSVLLARTHACMHAGRQAGRRENGSSSAQAYLQQSAGYDEGLQQEHARLLRGRDQRKDHAARKEWQPCAPQLLSEPGHGAGSGRTAPPLQLCPDKQGSILLGKNCCARRNPQGLAHIPPHSSMQELPAHIQHHRAHTARTSSQHELWGQGSHAPPAPAREEQRGQEHQPGRGKASPHGNVPHESLCSTSGCQTLASALSATSCLSLQQHSAVSGVTRRCAQAPMRHRIAASSAMQAHRIFAGVRVQHVQVRLPHDVHQVGGQPL